MCITERAPAHNTSLYLLFSSFLSTFLQTNTFQILLATQRSTTYAIFIYRNMKWKTARSSANGPVVGFTDGRGNAYQYNTTPSPTNHLSEGIVIFAISRNFTAQLQLDDNLESVAELQEALKQEKEDDGASMEGGGMEVFSEAEEEMEKYDDAEAQSKEEQIQKALKAAMQRLNIEG